MTKKTHSGEIEFTHKVCGWLEADGALVFPIVGSARQPRHWPDRLVVHRDFMLLLEFKGLTTPLTRGQLLTHNQINRRGAYAYVVKRTLTGGVISKVIGSDLVLVGEFCDSVSFLALLRGLSVRI